MFNIAVVIELFSVIALRLYRAQLNCIDPEHTEEGCDLNSTKNFVLRMTFVLLDTISKFVYCTYFLSI